VGNLVDFLEVTIGDLDPRLAGRSIDTPQTGQQAEAQATAIVGWIVGRSSPAVAVEVLDGDRVIGRSPVRIRRKDVAAFLPDTPGSDSAGFNVSVNLSGATELELTLQGVLANQARVHLGKLRARTRWRGSVDLDSTPMVSVIVPCYHQAHFLGECIESVLAQTYPHLEVVVIDDGSRDNTSEVAARYPGVRCFRQDNQGLTAARNTGLRRSNGEYLVFLDSDDRLLPDALELGLASLNAHPQCAFTAGEARVFTTGGRLLWRETQRRTGSSYADFLGGNCLKTPGIALFRRSVFEAVGLFDPQMKACSDYEMYLRIARRYPVCAHDGFVLEYRRHFASMSRDPELMLEAAVRVLRAQWPHARHDARLREAYRQGWRVIAGEFSERLAVDVRHRIGQRRVGAALRGLVTLARHYPRGLRAVVSPASMGDTLE
jgi:glycosyltransferase involved in cell wall biosynthesis